MFLSIQNSVYNNASSLIVSIVTTYSQRRMYISIGCIKHSYLTNRYKLVDMERFSKECVYLAFLEEASMVTICSSQFSATEKSS